MKIKVKMLLILLVTGGSAGAVGPSVCGSKLTTLTVGTDTAGSLGYVPFEQKSGGTITGFDVAVAVEVAHRLGFESTTFRQIPFSASISTNRMPLLNELNKSNSQIDLAIAALSIINRLNFSSFPPLPLNFPNIGYAKYSRDSLGIILRADANQIFSDPSTVLDELNKENTDAIVILQSRESQIIFPAYTKISAILLQTLEQVVIQFKANPGTTDIPKFILTDSATAEALGKLAATDSSLFGFPVQVLTNVIDQKNAAPSQGLGVAVGGVNESGTSCTQLLANVSQALKDMVADGTMALLRAQFNVASTDDEIGTITPTQTPAVAATINSNVIHNFYFTKYGTPTIIVGPDVPVTG